MTRDILLNPTLSPNVSRDESAADNAWEYQLVYLLSHLEQGWVALTAKKLPPQAVLKLLVAMVDRVVDFAMKHAKTSRSTGLYSEAFQQASLWYQSVQSLQKNSRSGLLKVLTAGRVGASQDPADENYLQTTRDVPWILSLFFQEFQGKFVSAAAGDGWNEVARIFLNDLMAVVNGERGVSAP